MIDKLRVIGQNIGKLMFPSVCPLCGEILEDNHDKIIYICQGCSAKLKPIKPPVCLKCGQEVDGIETDCCSDCRGATRSYVKGFPALKYSPEMSKCLSDFKYHNMRSYAAFLADIIVRERGKEILLAAPEVIVPVPIHKSKLKERGYNQAQVLGEELGRRLKLPVDTELILRDVKTAPQKELSNAQR
ncbi:MAG: ComF family protein, partial [Lachnospiraceae bacterium]|nr:ComF family protein [Lachnospiraceae bacterium]